MKRPRNKSKKRKWEGNVVSSYTINKFEKSVSDTLKKKRHS